MALMAKENIRTIQEQTNGARFQSQTVVFLWKNALPNFLVFVTQFYKQAEWNEKTAGNIISIDWGDVIWSKHTSSSPASPDRA